MCVSVLRRSPLQPISFLLSSHTHKRVNLLLCLHCPNTGQYTHSMCVCVQYVKLQYALQVCVCMDDVHDGIRRGGRSSSRRTVTTTFCHYHHYVTHTFHIHQSVDLPSLRLDPSLPFSISHHSKPTGLVC